MSTLTLSNSAARPSPFRALGSFFGKLFAGIREGYAIHQRYETLARLSDTALARMGLQRSDIPQAAVRGDKLA